MNEKDVEINSELVDAISSITKTPPFEVLHRNIVAWGDERGFVDIKNKISQALKVVSEVGELSDAVLKDDEEKVIDAIGDVIIAVVILSECLGLDVLSCVSTAYNVIKHRRGAVINGSFVKSDDIPLFGEAIATVNENGTLHLNCGCCGCEVGLLDDKCPKCKMSILEISGEPSCIEHYVASRKAVQESEERRMDF